MWAKNQMKNKTCKTKIKWTNTSEKLILEETNKYNKSIEIKSWKKNIGEHWILRA